MRIIGLMVCGAGEADRYLYVTLQEFSRLCDDAVICLNRADDKTKAMVKSFRFWNYEDNREWGIHQPSIKTDLLKRIAGLKPDWILPLDADEIMPSVDRAILEKLTVGRESCYFYIVNLWNSRDRYVKGLSFWNVRFFKFLPEKGMQYLKKSVHCGLAPPYFYSIPAKYSYVPHIVRHYGLMESSDRMKKVERYNTYDPHAVHKGRDYYDALASKSSGSEYSEEAVLRKLQEEVAKYA